MDARTTGIILRTRQLTETSLIVQWLTRDFGRIATVAKGARRPKSPFAGKLDLCFTADAVFARSRRSELHTLREVALLQTRESLRRDLAALQQAAYCVALIEQTTETDTPLPGGFELLTGVLDELAAKAGVVMVVAFEIKWLSFLGLAPDFAEAKLTAGSRALLTMFVEAEWTTVRRTRLTTAQHNEINAFLHGFLIYHLGKLPRGRQLAMNAGRSEFSG